MEEYKPNTDSQIEGLEQRIEAIEKNHALYVTVREKYNTDVLVLDWQTKEIGKLTNQVTQLSDLLTKHIENTGHLMEVVDQLVDKVSIIHGWKLQQEGI